MHASAYKSRLSQQHAYYRFITLSMSRPSLMHARCRLLGTVSRAVARPKHMATIQIKKGCNNNYSCSVRHDGGLFCRVRHSSFFPSRGDSFFVRASLLHPNSMLCEPCSHSKQRVRQTWNQVRHAPLIPVLSEPCSYFVPNWANLISSIGLWILAIFFALT
jgi:hypothetical protein